MTIHWELFRRIKVDVQLQDHVEGQKVPGLKRLVKAEAAKSNKYDKWSTAPFMAQNIFMVGFMEIKLRLC